MRKAPSNGEKFIHDIALANFHFFFVFHAKTREVSDVTISLLSFGGNLRKISTIKSNFLPFGGVKNGENALNFGKNVKRTCSSI